MRKFRMVADPNRKPWGSTHIIVDSVNKAAQKLGLYDENGLTIVYDTLAQLHGYKADAIMCAYELPFGRYILNSAKGLPFINLSLDNGLLALYGGYPPHLCNYASLGIDSNIWEYSYKSIKTDKFVFLCANESNTRSGFEDLILTFGQTFNNDDSVQLYIKDREVTDKFKQWVQDQAKYYNVDIFHDCRHIEGWEEQKKIFQAADAFVCVNHSHTYGLNRMNALATGVPLLTFAYQGGREYLSGLGGIQLEYNLEIVTNEKLQQLMNMGMRNYLFPITMEDQPTPCFWARVNYQDLSRQMLRIRKDSKLRQNLSITGRRIAEIFSWERTAANISLVLSEYYG